jgi:hypothetical protein
MAYIYRHIRLDKNEPFYIGIGSDTKFSRANSIKNRNKHWINIRNITDIKIDILIDNITWEEACEKEKEFIKLYGRKDLGCGTLCNLTDGGEGTIGIIVTNETKEKISKNSSKFWLGKIRPECSERLSKSNKDRIWSKKSKLKMSNSKKGENCNFYNNFGKDHPASKKIICVTTDVIYDSISEAARILKLNLGHIASVAKGTLSATGHKKYPGGLVFKYYNT